VREIDLILEGKPADAPEVRAAQNREAMAQLGMIGAVPAIRSSRRRSA
jgi:hypothetical protein